MRRFWPLPIWLHLTLTILVTVGGFFGGAFAGASLFFGVWSLAGGAIGFAPDSSCRTCACGVAFFGGALVGLLGGQILMTLCVPARCPRCGGRAYHRGGRPITYHCRDCRHVHATPVSDRGGGWGEDGSGH